MPLSSIFSSQKQILVFASLLVGLTLIAFSPVLKAQFLSGGDETHLTNNAHVLNFTFPHFKALLKKPVDGLHIPLSSLSFSLENHFFGLNPFIFHLNNLLFHMIAVVLVFFFARNLGLSPGEAFLGSLIFALHPSKVESVAWISQRKDMLYAIFYLAALLSYQKGRYWASVIFGFLSILANPMALSLPFIMVLLDWFNGKSIDVKSFAGKWPHFLMVIGIAWSAYFSHLHIGSVHFFQAALIWIWSFVFYIKQFFIPITFIPVYVMPHPVKLFSAGYLFPVLVFLFILLGVWLGRKNKWVVFAFVFYSVSIFFFQPVSDHFLYLSSLGFCFLSAVGIVRLHQFLKAQEAVIQYLFSAAVMMLILGLIFLTFNQSRIWQDAASLWGYQAKTSPNAAVLNHWAASLKDTREDRKKAVDLYQQAIAMDPQYVDSYNHLAEYYKDSGQLDEALLWYNKALVIDGKNKNVLFGLGVLDQKMNKPRQAIDTFKLLLKNYPDDEDVYIGVVDAYSKAIADHPQEKIYQEQREEFLSGYEELSKRRKYSAADYFNLAFLYEQVGGYEEAIRFYKKSLEINSTYEKSLYNLANRYQEMGDFKTALAVYERLVHFHPKFALGYLNMGVIYNAMGDADKARMLYQKTLDVEPGNVGAYFNLGYLNEASGNLKEALNDYEKALESDPQFAEGYYNMGNVYAALGQVPEAMASYLKTVAIDKKHQNAFVNLSILSFKSRDFVGAIRYLQEAQALGYTPPVEYLKSLEPYKRSAK